MLSHNHKTQLNFSFVDRLFFSILFDPTPHNNINVWNHIFWCCYGGILTFLMGTVCDRNSRQQFNDGLAIVYSVCCYRVSNADRWDRLRWVYIIVDQHKCDLSETIKVILMPWEWKIWSSSNADNCMLFYSADEKGHFSYWRLVIQNYVNAFSMFKSTVCITYFNNLSTFFNPNLVLTTDYT